MWLFLVLFLILIILPDIYIWAAFLKGAAVALWLKIAFWFPMATSIAALVAWAAGHHAEWLLKFVFVMLLCFAMPKVVFTILSLIGKGVALAAPKALFWCNTFALAAAAVTCVAFIYGLTAGWKRLSVKEVKVVSSELPKSFRGYKILQISDLHLGTYGKGNGGDMTAYGNAGAVEGSESVGRCGRNAKIIQTLVDKVNSLEPDMIVFTGDIVNSSAEEMLPYMEILREMKAKDGIYSVLGNHDYCDYADYEEADGAARNRGEVIMLERELGWNLLLDEHRIIRRGGDGSSATGENLGQYGDSIAIIGVENIGKGPFHKRGNLSKAMEGLESGTFKVLLSHDPSHWRMEVLPKTDVQLTLSGHTHAMQFSIGRLTPAAFMYREWGGLYKEGERALHVSLGVGGTLPFRLGAWPEINLITLE